MLLASNVTALMDAATCYQLLDSAWELRRVRWRAESARSRPIV